MALKPNAKPLRNEAIILACLAGCPRKDIAKEHRISVGRVNTLFRMFKLRCERERNERLTS